jgi:hypothetical protein
MFPIIPILAWTGGIAAGAQVAGGFVRGVGELVRGRPGAAMLHVADGCVAPLRMACTEVSRLGHDAYIAVLSPWTSEPQLYAQPEPELQVSAPLRRQRSRRRLDENDKERQTLNGLAEVATLS